MKTTETTVTKVLVHQHLNEINGLKDQAKALLPLLQTAINEAKEIGIELNNENFYQACGSPAQFAKAHFIKGIEAESIKPEFAGRKMKVESILEQYEFPDSSKFETAGSGVKKNLTAGVLPPEIMKIINGIAEINETEMQTIVDSYSIFASTPKEINLWNEYNKLTEHINTFNTFLKVNHNRDFGVHYGSFQSFFDDRAGKFAPQLHQFLSLRG